MKLVLFIGCLLSLNFSFSQTCVIAVKTKDSILIAADSKTTITTLENGQYVKQYESSCKIVNLKDKGFAVAGLFSDFSINTAKVAFNYNTDMIEVIRKYANDFNSILNYKLDSIKKSDPIYYLQLMEEKKPYISQIMFFGMQADTVFLSIAGFKIKEDLSLEFKAYNQYGGCCMGATNEINEEVLNPDTWKGNINETLVRLIGIEIKAHPDRVGLPIDILKYKTGLSTWIQKKEFCD